MTTLYDMLEQLGLDELLTHATEAEEKILETEIEIHQQRSYPLKGGLVNSLYNEDADKIQLAAGTASEYGDADVWETEF